MYVLDCEGYDPKLKILGDGSVRKDGSILCCGVYDGYSYNYYTMDSLRLKEILESDAPKILHNAMYDLSWLCIGYGLVVNGVVHDTMTRQAMIDEYGDLDLSSCCKYWHIAGKNAEDTIEAWFNAKKKLYGLKGSLWQNIIFIWDDPSGREQIMQYNKQDCIATWELFHAQEIAIKEVAEAYDIECRLIPMLLEMKRTGIRIDEVARDQFTAFIQKELKETEIELEYKYGLNRKIIASPKQMTEAMGRLGVKSEVFTATGAQSWSADALEMIDHPAAGLIQKVKNYKALLEKYLLSAFQDSVVDGRIHPTFLSSRRDNGGTITNRFSCLAEDTPVFTLEHGYIAIQDVKIGDTVITHTGKQASVEAVLDNGYQDCIEIDAFLFCTPDHLFYTSNGWQQAQYMEDCYVWEFKSNKRQKVLHRSSVFVRRKLKTAHKRSSQATRMYLPYSADYTKARNERLRETNGKEAEICKNKVWIAEPYVWKNTGKASQLQGRMFRSQRLYNCESIRLQESIYAPQSYGRYIRHICTATKEITKAKKTRGTSFRREWREQQSRQLSFSDSKGSRIFAQCRIYKVKKNVKLFCKKVYDLTIAHEDSSFLAAGYSVHNCKGPNLQQVPSKEEKHGQPTYGQKMRAMFLPEEGMMLAASDYTAIEACLLAHFAAGPQAEWLRERTRAGIDYHTATMEVTGIKDRGIMKTMNYGIMYGMGAATMFAMNRKIFGTLEHTMAVFDQYHKGLPVIRHTNSYFQNIMRSTGRLVTLGGRIIHKPKPVFKNGKWNDQLYKVMNREIQGSSADILKKAMVDIWESGICGTLKMHLTVHDELVASVPYNKEGTEALKEMNRLMVGSYAEKLLVPMRVNCEVGPSWGYWSDKIWKEMLNGEYNHVMPN